MIQISHIQTQKPDVDTVLKDCRDWAQTAAATVNQFFRKGTDVAFKEDQSPFTLADQTIELA